MFILLQLEDGVSTVLRLDSLRGIHPLKDGCAVVQTHYTSFPTTMKYSELVNTLFERHLIFDGAPPPSKSILSKLRSIYYKIKAF